MKKGVEKTKVIFRFWEDTVIAIFPEELGTDDYTTCMSYMHVGQHCPCTPDMIIENSKLAKPEEYARLKSELETVGYNLDIKKRYSYHSTIKRLRLLRGMGKI